MTGDIRFKTGMEVRAYDHTDKCWVEGVVKSVDRRFRSVCITITSYGWRRFDIGMDTDIHCSALWQVRVFGKWSVRTPIIPSRTEEDPQAYDTFC